MTIHLEATHADRVVLALLRAALACRRAAATLKSRFRTLSYVLQDGLATRRRLAEVRARAAARERVGWQAIAHHMRSATGNHGRPSARY